MVRQRRRRFATVIVLGTAYLLLVASASFAASVVSDQVVSPSAAHFPQNKQNESPMAVSPFNSSVVVSGANDEIEEPDCTVSNGSSSCPFDPQTDSTGIYVSTDGGSSYADYILNWYPQYGTVSNGDPVVAFGPKPGNASNTDGGRLYAGGIAIPPTAAANEAQYAIAWSDDQGQTWSAPVNISSRGSKANFNDKPSLWADANPDSPYYGNVYAAWTLFTGNGNFGKSSTFSPEPIMFSRSTDFGHTWSNAQKIAQFSRNNGANGGRQDSLIRSGPDGSVYVVWSDSTNKTSQLTFAKSTDGGKTFSNARGFAPVLDNPSPLPGASFRDGSPPAGDISQGSGAIFVTWTDYDADAGHGVVRLARSTNGGTSWTLSTVADVSGRSPFFPSVAVTPDGTKVIVGFPTINDVAADTTPGAGVLNMNASYVLSTDGGTTFGAPVVIRANAGDPEASSTNSLGAQFLGDYTGASADNTHAWFSWTDTSGGATCAAITSYRYGTGSKPDIYSACPANFGNTDIRVAEIAL